MPPPPRRHQSNTLDLHRADPGPFDSVSPVERSVGRAVWDAAALGVFRRPGVAGAAFRTAANTRGAA
ncbi:MAG: hypothetical protein ACRDD1_21780, partial [Planctomycetia bacterium]